MAQGLSTPLKTRTLAHEACEYKKEEALEVLHSLLFRHDHNNANY